MTNISAVATGDSSLDTSATAAALRPPWHRRQRVREAGIGWLFVAPVVVVFLVFFIAPILMALWVSLLDWNGQSNPITDFDFVGLDNYRRMLTEDSLLREDFAISVRNTVYYVAAFVPAVAVREAGHPQGGRRTPSRRHWAP